MAKRDPTPQVLALLAALVEDHVGVCYRLEDRGLLADKLLFQMEEAGFDSLLDYYYYLRYDDPRGEATTQLLDSLLVHETYFFRELHSLEVAIDHVVMPVVRRGERARVWSAGCATGEEAVSLAVLLAERQALAACELVASDVSERVLAHARRGRYRGRSLRTDGLELAARWLERDGDQLVVPRHLLDAISLRQVNLCDPTQVAALGSFDLVVCRHVLIYFSQPTIVATVDSIADRLRADGAVLVGVTESLSRFTTRLQGEELRGAFLYRRVS
jgi:chemotaxis protein methyltransferase CheR